MKKTITVRNHNGVIIYQGHCIKKAKQEAREYFYQTGNVCTIE